MTSNRSAHDSIKDLCEKGYIQESELISQLQAILQANPNVVYEKREDGSTLLHGAAIFRSPEFCQLLVLLNEDLVKTSDDGGRLPFHVACDFANVNTAKYLYKLYPESISIPDRSGYTALHGLLSCIQREQNYPELVEFLLDNDQGALSTPDHLGRLPLHTATQWSDSSTVKCVFNTYPEAIHTTDNDGDTPLYYAADRNEDEVLHFFVHQYTFERQARTDRTPNINGQLPIHRAIQSRNASLGAIKLMLAANQARLALADNQGHTPLHIACHAGNHDAAKYLMRVNHDSLKAADTRGNLPLHLACKQGNCDVISCILQQSTYGVILQNLDNRTPIELLLYESERGRHSMAYVEAIRSLFQVNPDETLKCLMKKEDGSAISDNGGVGNKRKRA